MTTYRFGDRNEHISRTIFEIALIKARRYSRKCYVTFNSKNVVAVLMPWEKRSEDEVVTHKVDRFGQIYKVTEDGLEPVM